MKFFCPHCGVALVPHPLPNKRGDKSLWFECHNESCSYDDTVFIVHHPFHGTESAPGDSWSITWLK